MCKVVEERAKEYANEQQIENIKRMLASGDLTHEKIAMLLDVDISLVDNVANGKVA